MAIHPSNFGAPVEQALIAELNKKYANRVLHGVGLCICVFDLSQAGEGKVRYGDGCLWYKGSFLSLVTTVVADYYFASGISYGRVSAICFRSDRCKGQIL
jgi:DNA-directed RNA polymerase subunit E'/Rpb7